MRIEGWGTQKGDLIKIFDKTLCEGKISISGSLKNPRTAKIEHRE
jgi:hypothetical protein